MTPTERPGTSPSQSKGALAALCASMRLRGIRAPFGARIAMVLVVAVAGSAALTAAPALAAPEAPEALPPTEVKATTASFNGVLSPHAPGEAGSFYRYVYKASTTKECEGGSESAGGIAGGAEHEVLPGEPVTGLTAGTEYAVCLVAENLAKTERIPSPAISFTTAIPPEVPTGLEAKPIASTTATLNAVLNTLNPGEAGSYAFLYQQFDGILPGR